MLALESNRESSSLFGKWNFALIGIFDLEIETYKSGSLVKELSKAAQVNCHSKSIAR